jgi:hypothetical protein
MNLKFLGFMAILIAVVIIGLVIYIFRKIYKSKDEPTNAEIIINGFYNYTDGYGLGLVDKKEGNQTKTKLTMIPRDIDYDKLRNEDIKIERQEVIVKNNLLIPLGFSNNRKISLALPDKAENLPQELLNHPFGLKVMEFIESQQAKTETIDIQRIREKNLMKVIRKSQDGGVEIVGDFIEERKELDKDLGKIRTEQINPPKDPAKE